VKKIIIGFLLLAWARGGILLAEDNEKELWNAVKNENPILVKFYLQQKVDCNRLDRLGATPLHWAAMVGNHEITLLLLQHGANIKASHERLSKPLLIAATNGYTECVKHLIDYDNEIDAPNSDGLTALHVAARGGHIAVVKLLLESGASKTVQTNLGQTPLHFAQIKKNAELIDLLS